MINKSNWEGTKAKWASYWKRQNSGAPLMCIVANKEEARDLELEAVLKSKSMEDKYFDAKRIVDRFRYYANTHEYMAESFPNLSIDFGPGSMAAYLGCDIVFDNNTVWFQHFVDNWADYKKLEFDPDNKWFKKHIKLFEDVKALTGDDFLIGIPDIIENLDTLGSMRGVQETIFDLLDYPDEMKKRLNELDDIYYDYYDRFYDIVKDKDGGSCYTVFQIWGPGRTAKLQCDFSAMMSPNQYREFVQGSLDKQSQNLDHVLYHLDGPDAIKHADAIMEIDKIDALQWTSGDYGPDGTMEEWYGIYDKAVEAGKGLWVKVYSGEFETWLERLDKLVHRYGTNALFLYFSPMPMEQAEKLMEHANKNWCDIEGIIKPKIIV